MLPLKFGIIGCSRIAKRSVIPAILKSKFAELEMIGSRTQEKSKEFANEFNCKKYGTYDDVISDDSIDAVYISTPIGTHAKWSNKAASAGKHVYCEKSSTDSLISAREMVECAKQNNIRLMEGFMFRSHPQHQKVKELINDGKIGEMKSFNGVFGFPAFPVGDIRYDEGLGGGFLNDSGCYPICASRMIFNEEPVTVGCQFNLNAAGVDVKGTSFLIYKNQKSATITYGNGNYYQAKYEVWGSDGVISLDRAYSVPSDFITKVNLQHNTENNWEGRRNEIFEIQPKDHFLEILDTFCMEITGSEKTLRQDVKSPWFLFAHIADLHGGYLQMMHEEDYAGINQYDKMLSAIDPWLGKIFQCIDLENTICVITSDHGSILSDFTNEMFNFSLENDRLRELEPGIGFNSAHKIVTNFPKKLTPLRRKMAKIYTKYRNDKVKKKLEPRLDQAENLNLSPYQKRLLKKVHFVNPSDCFDEGLRSALILLGPNLPSGKIISTQISSIDLFPTILDLIKIPTKINHHGKSLVPLFSNTKNDERVVMVDSGSDGSQEQYSNTIGLRTKQYKYFRDRFSESKNVHLYDLENDPFELSNISEQNPDIIENLEREFLQINPTGNFAFKKTQEFSDEEAEKIEKDLKKLGYIN